MTADAVGARTFADGRKEQATGTFGGTVTNLVVAGAAVSVPPGGQFAIPGIGYGAVNERRVVRSGGALPRLRGRAPHPPQLGLAQPARGHRDPARLRAGRRLRDVTAAKSPPGDCRGAGAGGRRGAGRRVQLRPGQLDAPVVPLPPGDKTPTETGSGPTGIEAPPPGGFTLTPPIDAPRQQQLIAPGYVFPVAGGALYGHDFGNFRADTIFHQGSDLFAPEGSPLVAVQAGVLHSVGWNRLGGWRLWLEDLNHNWFYYAHLSAFAPIAVEGARVKAGDVVGFMGSTGDADGRPVAPAFRDPPGGSLVGAARMITSRPGRVIATRSPPSRASRRPSRPRSSNPPTSPPPPGSTPRRFSPSRAAFPSTPASSRSASPRRPQPSCSPQPPPHDTPDSSRCAPQGARARIPLAAAGACRLQRARRALGRGHGAAALVARAARARRAAADAERAGLATRRRRHDQAAAADARRLPARGRRDEPRPAPHRLPLVAVRLRAGLHVLRHRPHGPRPQPRRPRRSASSCCGSRGCCATSRTRASRTS